MRRIATLNRPISNGYHNASCSLSRTLSALTSTWTQMEVDERPTVAETIAVVSISSSSPSSSPVSALIVHKPVVLKLSRTATLHFTNQLAAGKRSKAASTFIIFTYSGAAKEVVVQSSLISLSLNAAASSKASPEKSRRLCGYKCKFDRCL